MNGGMGTGDFSVDEHFGIHGVEAGRRWRVIANPGVTHHFAAELARLAARVAELEAAGNELAYQCRSALKSRLGRCVCTEHGKCGLHHWIERRADEWDALLAPPAEET